MQRTLRASSLVPPGFVVMGTENDGGKTIIVVRSTAKASRCPSCGTDSRQIHSHYQRRLADLPMAGRSMQLVALVRRYRCRAVRCAQGIFAERFAAGILAPWARRTGRLDELVHYLGLALGGRPSCKLRQAVDAAGQQRHVVESGTAARVASNATAKHYRHRRLGLAPQSPLRHHHMRP